jgi:hypothetical protein
MDEHEKKAREAYYRDTYILKRKASPSYVEAQTYFNQTLARLNRDPRVKVYIPETATVQANYMAQHYGDVRPKGVGMRLGESITIDATHVDEATRFIATDSLIDCQGLVLVARDSHGKVVATQLSHFDRLTAADKAIPELLAQMPPNTRIEATVLNGPHGYNYYLQADILKMLVASDRVKKIRYNFDGATTIGVDTTTGKILTTIAPVKPPEKAYEVTHLPLDITLRPIANESGMLFRRTQLGYFDQERAWPSLGIENVYTQGIGFRTLDDMAKFIGERQSNDGALSAAELSEIALAISSQLHTEVKLHYQAPVMGLATIEIISAKGKSLDVFYSAKLDPALGSAGTIEPPNTPPAPGRGLATNTTSQPSGKAPTGRQ